jgi:hypothetical protein
MYNYRCMCISNHNVCIFYMYINVYCTLGTGVEEVCWSLNSNHLAILFTNDTDNYGMYVYVCLYKCVRVHITLCRNSCLYQYIFKF